MYDVTDAHGRLYSIVADKVDVVGPYVVFYKRQGSFFMKEVAVFLNPISVVKETR